MLVARAACCCRRAGDAASAVGPDEGTDRYGGRCTPFLLEGSPKSLSDGSQRPTSNVSIAADGGDPRVGAVSSHALLPSLGLQEFKKKQSAIVGPMEFPLVTDSSPNNLESTSSFHPTISYTTSIYSSDQMGPDKLLDVRRAKLDRALAPSPTAPGKGRTTQLTIDNVVGVYLSNWNN